eukprot:COSAG05_NODE_213_length_13909_cov_7.240550_6_plen_82_part_00
MQPRLLACIQGARGSRIGHIVAAPRARARQQIKISRNSRTPSSFAVKMGDRTVHCTIFRSVMQPPDLGIPNPDRVFFESTS